ncbi:MAG TPA: hypothetical protein VGY94_11290 [Acidobacteriaceae bacterium]|jgi:hypothetical protein|nr:hypothetical protein [Acidobacteriaceae bacterium]
MLTHQNFLSFRQAKPRRFLLSALAVLATAVSVQAAFAANITVASPVSGTTTQSPLLVKAHNVGCNNLAPVAFAFSVDNSTSTTWAATAYDIDVTNTSMSTGTHTIHFKAWTTAGICPIVNSTVTIAAAAAPPPDGSSGSGTPISIPSNAIASADLDTATNWAYEHDTGTPGSSRGSTLFPATTPVYDDAREFYMTYSGRGGERWHDSFANDSTSTHFVLDTYVYVVNPDQLANLELDLNQVMSNGETVIFGTQCSTYSGTWEWTYYGGGSPHWKASNIKCDPRTWAANTWHHIQIGFHRDSTGYATHDWVVFDGTQSTFSGAAAGAAKSLGWYKGSMIMNVQMDGFNKTSGDVTAYFHKITFYRW